MGSCAKGTIGCLVIQVSPSILIFYSIAELLEKKIGTLLLGTHDILDFLISSKDISCVNFFFDIV